MVPEITVGDTLDFSDGAVKFVLVAQDKTVCENWTIAVYHPITVDYEKAVIDKGEGVCNPFARQVALKPVAWGYIGALSDSVALKKWIGDEAYRKAIETGYVELGTNRQVRVAKVGVLYVLGKNDDGKTTVTEYAETPKDNTIKPTDVNVAASSLKEAKFAGANQESIAKHVQSYEYIFTLSTCPSPCPQEKDACDGNVIPEIEPIVPSGPVSFDDLPPVPIFPALE